MIAARCQCLAVGGHGSMRPFSGQGLQKIHPLLEMGMGPSWLYCQTLAVWRIYQQRGIFGRWEQRRRGRERADDFCVPGRIQERTLVIQIASAASREKRVVWEAGCSPSHLQEAGPLRCSDDDEYRRYCHRNFGHRCICFLLG